MKTSRIVSVLVGLSVCASGAAWLRWQQIGGVGVPDRVGVAPIRSLAGKISPDSLEGAEDAIVTNDPFRLSNSPAAVLHALDGATGKELWNSGKTMTAPVRTSGLSAIGSQVYLGTSDGMIYAFGFPIEH